MLLSVFIYFGNSSKGHFTAVVKPGCKLGFFLFGTNISI